MLTGNNTSDESDEDNNKYLSSGKRFSEMVSTDSAQSNISSRFVPIKRLCNIYIYLQNARYPSANM